MDKKQEECGCKCKCSNDNCKNCGVRQSVVIGVESGGIVYYDHDLRDTISALLRCGDLSAPAFRRVIEQLIAV